MRIKCLTCNQIVEGDPRRVVGCFCDSDAPTWIAIERDNKVLSGSYSKWIEWMSL